MAFERCEYFINFCYCFRIYLFPLNTCNTKKQNLDSGKGRFKIFSCFVAKVGYERDRFGSNDARFEDENVV